MSELNHWTFVAEHAGDLICDTIEASTIGHARRIALLVLVEHGWLDLNMIMWCPVDSREPIDDDTWLGAVSSFERVSLYRRYPSKHASSPARVRFMPLGAGPWARIAALWTGRAA